METPKLIEIVIAAIVAVIAKEALAWLTQKTKKLVPILRSNIIAWIRSHTRAILGSLNIAQSIFQGYLAYYISTPTPPKKGQMFFVALFMCAAFHYFILGVRTFTNETT